MRNIDGSLKKPFLKVFPELPHGILEEENAVGSLYGLRTARGYIEEIYKHFYFCPKCEGWIEGHPTSRYENNIEPMRLAGRRGHVEDCERCGYELAFRGMVS